MEQTAGAGDPIDNLCCSSHIRNRPETVWGKRSSNFRIVGTFRSINDANLSGQLREQSDRRGYAASVMNKQGIIVLIIPCIPLAWFHCSFFSSIGDIRSPYNSMDAPNTLSIPNLSTLFKVELPIKTMFYATFLSSRPAASQALMNLRLSSNRFFCFSNSIQKFLGFA